MRDEVERCCVPANLFETTFYDECLGGATGGDADADAETGPDAEDGADGDGEGDVDTDAGVDADVCTGIEAGSPCSPGAEPPGTWCDSASGLLWQASEDGVRRTWDEAVAYCEGLSLAGHDDWGLPTVGELRSLIRGCVQTETCGECGIADDCLEYACGRWPPCDGCARLAGPGEGCYWPSAVGGTCACYWSSSACAGGVSTAWNVLFDYGWVTNDVKTRPYYVRCVRRGP